MQYMSIISTQRATNTFIKFLMHVSLAWMWEYGLRNSLIDSTQTYIAIAISMVICLAAISEFLVGLERKVAVLCSFVFCVGWLCFRHILYVNIIWSLLLTYMIWANPTPFRKPRAPEYVMASLLTFLATAGVQITQTHWIGVTIRMIPLVNIWYQIK